jgi:hypothetical protein
LNVERSSKVAALLKELHIRPLPREGEPPVLREAEEVLPLVIDEVRDAALLVERRLKLVKSCGPPMMSNPEQQPSERRSWLSQFFFGS